MGLLFGYLFRHLVALSKRGSIEVEIKKLLVDAKGEAQIIKDSAEREKQDAEKKKERVLAELKEEEKRLTGDIKRTEERLVKKEEMLDKRQVDIDREVAHVKEQAEEIKKIKERADEIKVSAEAELARVANLSKEEAREILLKEAEQKYSTDLFARIVKLEREGAHELEEKARNILAASIHRIGNTKANEFMSTAVPLPSDEIKGKIIGKEGRNIKAFERAAGVELVVDDTPEVIIVSSFDPVRRYIARTALEELIADGRIQPAKIEEVVAKKSSQVEALMKKKGEDAVYECGLLSLDPRLIPLIGRLHFRTSYTQNVLQHSIEMAHISGILAAELGGDVQVAKAGALLHDIGKAVDHEIQGTHVEIGRKILQKYGVDNRVIQAMQSHHEEYPYETLESIIVQTADAISGGRPGARRDSAENYLKRLADLEAIANSFEGIEKSYAIQAGREIRVFVDSGKVSDLTARNIAREIALRVEEELRYPGEIKVHVIRETRIIEFAR